MLNVGAQVRYFVLESNGSSGLRDSVSERFACPTSVRFEH